MAEYLFVGPTPAEESCAQVGQDDYEALSTRECGVYLRMLHRLFPVPAELMVWYVIRIESHGFRRYREVAVKYDYGPDLAVNEATCDFAYDVEKNSPTEWDDIARYELAWLERKAGYRTAQHEGRIKNIPDIFEQHDVPPPPPEGKTLAEWLVQLP